MPFSLLKAFFGNYAISRSPLDSSSGDSTHSTGDTGTRAAAVSRHYRVTARNKHNHSRPHSQLYQVLLSLFTLTLELSTNLRESFCNVVQSGEGPCWKCLLAALWIFVYQINCLSVIKFANKRQMFDSFSSVQAFVSVPSLNIVKNSLTGLSDILRFMATISHIVRGDRVGGSGWLRAS